MRRRKDITGQADDTDAKGVVESTVHVPRYLQRRVQDPVQPFGNETVFYMLNHPECVYLTAGFASLALLGAGVGIHSQPADS